MTVQTRALTGGGGGGGGAGTISEIIAGAGLTGSGLTGPTATLDVGAGTHITVNANDVAVDLTTLNPALDHGLLGGLGDDDHTQYLLLAGRAGGQAAFGGTAASEELILRGTTAANLGLLRARSPIVFDDVSPANALSPYSVSDASTQSYTAPFIGGTFNASPNITFTNATFIYEAMRGAPTITPGVNPAFAAFALFQALPTLAAGSGGTHNPLQAIIVNAGATHLHAFTGARTAPANIGMNFAPQVRTTSTGTLSVTNTTAVITAPIWNTAAGSTTSFGTIRGLWMQNPSVALFGSSAGTELMTAYIGLDFSNITFGGTVPKVALRSALTAAANAYMIQNTGGAGSDFGAGFIHLNDNAHIRWGATDTTSPLLTAWSTADTAFLISTFFGLGTNPLLLQPAASNVWSFKERSGSVIGLGFSTDAIVFGTTTPTPAANNWFVQFSAKNGRRPWSAGGYADVLWTAGGSIAVSGLAITDLDAFKINALGYTLGGGSVLDVSTLHVAQQSSDGIATRSQALRVQGRARFESHMNHPPSTALATLTANVTQLTMGPNNAQRHVYLVDADASGPWTIRGILNVQVGDSFYIVNDGANSFLLGHQDGTAAAADRIISPTGASLTLGTNEMAKLWYDTSVSRWRILEHTGT